MGTIQTIICILPNDGIKFLRASNKPEKPGVIPLKRDDMSLPTSHQPVKKLEDNRRLMLEQQLGKIQQPFPHSYNSTQINSLLLFSQLKVHKVSRK